MVELWRRFSLAACAVAALSTAAQTQPGPVCGPPPGPQNLLLTYRGEQSGCTPHSAMPCQRNENITFELRTFMATFQPCDRFEWNFGDSTSSSAGQSVSHVFTGNASGYVVRVRVYNVVNPSGTTVTADVLLDFPATETPLVLEFAASRSQVTWGDSVTLTWKLKNFDTVKLFPYGLSFSGATGSYTFRPVRTQRYTLAGSFPSAQGGASLTITVEHSRRRSARH